MRNSLQGILHRLAFREISSDKLLKEDKECIRVLSMYIVCTRDVAHAKGTPGNARQNSHAGGAHMHEPDLIVVQQVQGDVVLAHL